MDLKKLKLHYNIAMSDALIKIYFFSNFLRLNNSNLFLLTDMKTIGLVWTVLPLMVPTLNGIMVNVCRIVTPDGGSKYLTNSLQI